MTLSRCDGYGARREKRPHTKARTTHCSRSKTGLLASQAANAASSGPAVIPMSRTLRREGKMHSVAGETYRWLRCIGRQWKQLTAGMSEWCSCKVQSRGTQDRCCQWCFDSGYGVRVGFRQLQFMRRRTNLLSHSYLTLFSFYSLSLSLYLYIYIYIYIYSRGI